MDLQQEVAQQTARADRAERQLAGVKARSQEQLRQCQEQLRQCQEQLRQCQERRRQCEEESREQQATIAQLTGEIQHLVQLRGSSAGSTQDAEVSAAPGGPPQVAAPEAPAAPQQAAGAAPAGEELAAGAAAGAHAPTDLPVAAAAAAAQPAVPAAADPAVEAELAEMFRDTHVSETLPSGATTHVSETLLSGAATHVSDSLADSAINMQQQR
ncbi:hypothetical protein C2E20_3579 [Micractinium conductrix]|uniref:Uncharacterized protein n=1 Tax=Micractinium conductrix TaxID=554055 RepID=A0A2P6VFX5_9CHLO|nr:hypothetical protein C2E20_3579 [Micractinium conductrix]|eukprot:PSC72971.1 hypothetical protein C2E20_3579 [Micractinium conductrix]